ncbi:unnamed protein product [Protopolystoma xenopodis]|uniref:UBP34/UBP24/USP9X/USP9Y-like ARM repeat region domain-containing protein n=1 Tax=Protopolystoma xenopodis TaxID=117903 RepID=A0A448XL48_9PLAT|nr:unnamed protein product [Protopolystoma xenopodis]
MDSRLVLLIQIIIYNRSLQRSSLIANPRQRERLIDLIRRLAEDDVTGQMANKSLHLLWQLATSGAAQGTTDSVRLSNTPTPATLASPEIVELALAAQCKILETDTSEQVDSNKLDWLLRLLSILKLADPDDTSVIPAIKQIINICSLFRNSVR